MSAIAAALWDRVKHLPFWCDTCTGWHPLTEHATCRALARRAAVARARQALTKEDPGA